jgi:hypothetical protein
MRLLTAIRRAVREAAADARCGKTPAVFSEADLGEALKALSVKGAARARLNANLHARLAQKAQGDEGARFSGKIDQRFDWSKLREWLKANLPWILRILFAILPFILDKRETEL